MAIKEILTGRLNKKLEESLMSEIVILQTIDHPNIIRLHEMIKEPGKIHLVLEYCKGGDLSMFIQKRHGRIPEANAKHFMLQLAAGLKVLRDNNLIHRDLKPQNLLLSSNDENSVLKIADFGFARSLQPRGLAETMCGSPLYMAPEIMQLQKYDAKADLWSVGAILFQLVTGKTPFTGNSQMQLLQNIIKSKVLRFPVDVKDLSSDCIDLCRKLLRQNPVERLMFEEFFNHPFLSQTQPIDLSESRSTRATRPVEGFPYNEQSSVRSTEESSSREDFLPFPLDYDSGSPSFAKPAPIKSTYGFSLDKTSSPLSKQNTEDTVFRIGNRRPVEGILKESLKSADQQIRSKVADSSEFIEQDYVFVSGPPVDGSSLSASASKHNLLPKYGSVPTKCGILTSSSSAPVPIRTGAVITTFENRSSAPSGTLQGSMDIGDPSEQPASDCTTRIKSLQRCAAAITELVNEKMEAGKQLEAFSIQFVILAIWKQALHICYTEAASAIEGSGGSQENRRASFSSSNESIDTTKSPEAVCTRIEKAFFHEVSNAEDLAKVVQPGNTEMPDAMETIFQSALALGRHGAVDEYMGDTSNAAVFYSKAVKLLEFLLVEAPSLILTPPFTLTTSDRYRLRMYIDLLNNRQNHSNSQRMAILKCRGPPP